jgi:hypothetical protein
MELVEIIFLLAMAIVFLFFHCFCWKNCSFKKKTHGSGSFIIKKKEEKKKNVK